MLADRRQVVPGEQAEGCDPDDDECRQPPVEPGDHDQRGDGVDDHEPDDLDEALHQVAGRLPRLPDLCRDAAGEVVLEEGIGLARDMAVGLPAHQVVEARRDRLLVDQRRQADDDGADDEHDCGHEQHFGSGRVPQGRPAAVVGQAVEDVDQPADEIEQSRLDERGDAADDQHGEEGEPGLADIVPEKTPDRCRGTEVPGLPERIDPILEPLVDSVHQYSGPGPDGGDADTRPARRVTIVGPNRPGRQPPPVRSLPATPGEFRAACSQCNEGTGLASGSRPVPARGPSRHGFPRQRKPKSAPAYPRRRGQSRRCRLPSLAIPHRPERQQQQAEAEEAAEQRHAAKPTSARCRRWCGSRSSRCPVASAEPRTGTTLGSVTPPVPAMPPGASRRTSPLVASAVGRSTSSVETTSANSGALTGPTWASAVRSPLPIW